MYVHLAKIVNGNFVGGIPIKHQYALKHNCNSLLSGKNSFKTSSEVFKPYFANVGYFFVKNVLTSIFLKKPGSFLLPLLLLDIKSKVSILNFQTKS